MNQGGSESRNTGLKKRLASEEEEGMEDVKGVEVHTSSEVLMIEK